MKSFWKCFVYAVLAGLIIGSASLFRAHASSVEHPVSVCFALREGASLASIEMALEEQGLTPAEAGTAAGIAVRDHCPDQINNVLEQVR